MTFTLIHIHSIVVCYCDKIISNRLIDFFTLATQQTGLAPYQKVSLRYFLSNFTKSHASKSSLNTSIPRHQQKMKDITSMRV